MITLTTITVDGVRPNLVVIREQETLSIPFHLCFRGRFNLAELVDIHSMNEFNHLIKLMVK
jgi:hypothetical protein